MTTQRFVDSMVVIRAAHLANGECWCGHKARGHSTGVCKPCVRRVALKPRERPNPPAHRFDASYDVWWARVHAMVRGYEWQPPQ